MNRLEAIEARLKGVPDDLCSDWQGTNHYELSTPDEPFWMAVREDLELLFGGAPVDWSATDTGRKLGLMMDTFATYKPDLEKLLAVARAAANFVRNAQASRFEFGPVGVGVKPEVWYALCEAVAPLLKEVES